MSDQVDQSDPKAIVGGAFSAAAAAPAPAAPPVDANSVPVPAAPAAEPAPEKP